METSIEKHFAKEIDLLCRAWHDNDTFAAHVIKAHIRNEFQRNIALFDLDKEKGIQSLLGIHRN